MKIPSRHVFAVAALFTLTPIVATVVAQTARVKKDAVGAIGKPFASIPLRDIKSGKTVDLASFKGKKVVVAIFMANFCGTTWQYEAKIGKLLRDYQKKGVEVVAIHANQAETDADIKGQMDSRNLPLAILDDKKEQKFKRFVGAEVTPTFVVIDKAGNLRYRGAFDQRPKDDATPYLRPALDAVLAGKPVKLPETRAFG